MKKCNIWFSDLWSTICHSVSVASLKYFFPQKLPTVKLALVAIALAVAACGSGGGGGGGGGGGSDSGGSVSSASGFVVSGTVSAPGGAVAFLPRKNIFEQITDALISSAYAAISGFVPVADGTTVALVRINSLGEVISELATTKTSSGNYSFDLTALGLSTASDLIVQVSNSLTGAKMRAFVGIDGAVNLDTISETTVRLVLEKIASTPGLSLSNFTTQELTDIAAAVTLLIYTQQLSGGADIESTVSIFKTAVSVNTGIVAFVTAASAPGQSSEGPGDIGNYFPLSQGDTWFYGGTVSDGGLPSTSFNNTVTYSRSKTLNSISVAVLSESNPGNGGADEIYLTKGTSGVTNYGNNDVQDFFTHQLIPYQEIRFPLKIGSTFEQLNKLGLNWPDSDFDGLSETAKAVSLVTIVGFEDVTVTAGNFSNCAKVVTVLTVTITYTSDGSEAELTETDTSWYAPGVGSVKNTNVIEVTGQGVVSTETEQLTGYIVSGQTNGISIHVVPSAVSVGLGGAQQFTATAFDPFNNPISGVTFTWASSNLAVASINVASGLATGVAKGTTQITASSMGIISNPVTLKVVDQRQIALAAKDLIYDPFRNKIYASVPSSAGAIGNTITVIDPETGAVGPSVPIGSEPGTLAISDNGQYLYVALDGAAAVRRLILASMTPDIQFSLGSDFIGTYYAGDIEVLPGSPGSVAVSRGYTGGGNAGHAGVGIYDNGVVRPITTPSFSGTGIIISKIEFSASATRLYGYNSETTGSEFHRMTVNNSGISILDTIPNVIYSNNIKFDNGLLYSTSGRVFDPEARTLVGIYPLTTPYAGYAVRPDSANNLVFFLEYESSAYATIQAYNMSAFLRLGSETILGAANISLDDSLIRWGKNGLAFRTNDNKVIIVRSVLIP